MKVTKQQILNGAAKYIRSEMIPSVTDRGFKVILEALAAILEMRPKVVDSFFANPMLAAIMQDEDGVYDLDIVETALVRAADAHGGLTLTVKPIPLLSPHEKEMTFTGNDIKAIKRYIEHQQGVSE